MPLLETPKTSRCALRITPPPLPAATPIWSMCAVTDANVIVAPDATGPLDEAAPLPPKKMGMVAMRVMGYSA